MIAPTEIYNNIPTPSPEGAADLIAEAIIYKPPCITMGLCVAEEVLHTVAPKILQVIMNTSFPMFPDSDTAVSGKAGEGSSHRRI